MQQTAQYLHLPELMEYRRAALYRRAAAFTGAKYYVLGVPVCPVTPRTHSMLIATRSRFLVGGLPDEEDIINFLGFHSPSFVYPDHPEWRARKKRAIRPLMLHALGWWGARLFRRPTSERYAATLALAATDIGVIVNDAFADAPSTSNDASAPVATLEASMVHAFGSLPGWTPERVSNTPLKVLFQLYRCLCSSRGQEVRDRNEDAILANHLARRNAELAAKRHAAAVDKEASNV
jgi:hypothetical protein